MGERIRQAIERLGLPHPMAGEGACVTISVGVSHIDYVAPELRRNGYAYLMKCADEALYQAKENGRNQVAFKPYVSPRF